MFLLFPQIICSAVTGCVMVEDPHHRVDCYLQVRSVVNLIKRFNKQSLKMDINSVFTSVIYKDNIGNITKNAKKLFV